jgi:hypothetical protein
MYAVEVLMFIRREYDTQAGTINLLKLFSQMKDRPTVLSRGRYRSRYDTMTAPASVKDDLANNHFDTFDHIKGPTPSLDYVSPAQIDRDRKAVEASTDVVREYTNRDLAHRTPDWNTPSIGVPDDLDPPLAAILATFNRYYPLLTGKSLGDPTPAITFNWQECLTHALATPEYFDMAAQGLAAARRAKSQEVLARIVRGKTPPLA